LLEMRDFSTALEMTGAGERAIDEPALLRSGRPRDGGWGAREAKGGDRLATCPTFRCARNARFLDSLRSLEMTVLKVVLARNARFLDCVEMRFLDFARNDGGARFLDLARTVGLC
jgi:hypothetical protein